MTGSSASPAPAAPRGAWSGPALGLASAALFGASTPVAKLLVPGAGPLVLAGLLYAGAGLGLVLAGALRRGGAEAPIRRTDLPALAGAIVAGGVAGPLLLVLGLARLSGLTASLLLNLEAPCTIAIAVLFLGERLSRVEAAGAVAILAGAAALSWGPGTLRVDPVGAACVAGACLAWAVDSNLNQKLALRDPVAVARAKAIVAGAFDLALGLAIGERLPSAGPAAAALVTGSLGYGASVVLYLLAVRSLGAARQAAWFATAPFVGAAVAVPLLRERVLPVHVAAAAVMALGTVLLARARHAHPHVHEPLEHEHAHVHDAHHAHVHEGPVTEPHAHLHRHERLVHDHPHLPDLHHRHGHGPG